ncbi:MAG: ATP-binding cassette domain-containing protein, partial [Planctomycetes bacterium]|nr:ATP-binding cassette domain-containing protein [Planctomycetota bacterium]
MTQPSPILELRDVTKRFVRPLDLAAKIANLFGAGLKSETVHAVDHVSLGVSDGEVVGLVGESGCGKSTLGRIVAGIHRPTTGERLWRGTAIDALPPSEQRAVELKVQMIFQDPMSSLNPRLRVSDIVGEAPVVHGVVPAAERDAYVGELLQRVGLDAAFRR